MKPDLKDAIDIVRKGRHEVTWYKEKADKYNKALDLLLSLAQDRLDGKIAPVMTREEVELVVINALDDLLTKAKCGSNNKKSEIYKNFYLLSNTIVETIANALLIPKPEIGRGVGD